MGWFSRDEPQRPSGPTPGTVDAVGAALVPYVRWLRSLGSQVPGRAMVLCRLIGDHLEDVVGDPSAKLLDVQTLVTLERTASAHVPDTINAYLAARGVSGAQDMLIRQLTTIEGVAASAAKRSIESARDALEIQGAFLEEKFGHA
ncbi:MULTISPECIES: hypothetical protein [unclassified Dermacoccus]|uniref:Uncharacterized protein n=1 Tax=Dermacoccus abyssi TaxID=322596 RepID=A0ABX5ZC86_9MICO|nr:MULTISPECIES: hypothetical protein [unclassified Dermacoccus]KLO63948.1 hypothetical protein AA983_04410 [Dermacoccus sp. PE3]MBZ4498974.1 hypothetical protein [Dermacoccus sp. Tok2021]QEH94468.1 hypothetical protein FV141_13795 [Dermacoccus abyssi]RYI20759.1 hypothetical protein EVU97_13635 [Dermacoccus sp. 147Ba]